MAMSSEEEREAGQSNAEATDRAEALLKLYGMLTDQVHKNSTLLWAIPTTLVAANTYLAASATPNPYAMITLAVFDAAMTYTCIKIRRTQIVIIDAVKKIELEFRNNIPSYGNFFPDFTVLRPLPGAAGIVVYVLGVMTIAMFVWGIWNLNFCNP